MPSSRKRSKRRKGTDPRHVVADAAAPDNNTDKEVALTAAIREGSSLTTSMTKFGELWRNGSFCDIVVKVGGESFQAHRLVLAAGSDYMEALLCEDRFSDSSVGTIELVDVSAASFSLVLEWLYEGCCKPKDSQMVDLLETASRLQCTDLLAGVEDALVKQLDKTTISSLTMWEVADRMFLGKLAHACEMNVLQNYGHFATTEVFLELPASKLTRLVTSKWPLMKNEEEIFKSVITWIQAQKAKPPSSEEIAAIFDGIRFATMSQLFIEECVEVQPIVMDNPGAAKSLYNSMKDKAYGKKTARSTKRSIDIIWEEISQADCLKVRIKDEPRLVQALFDNGWDSDMEDEEAIWESDMEDFLGAEYVVNKHTKSCREWETVRLDGYWWPITALERVPSINS